MFTFTLKLLTCFIKNPLAEKRLHIEKSWIRCISRVQYLNVQFAKLYMLFIFRVQSQRFRIILGEISQIIIAIKQWCKSFFFSSAGEADEHFFRALQVSSNLIFRSLDFVCGNQIEINEIFLLIKILKYLVAFTALLCNSNCYLLPKM